MSSTFWIVAGKQQLDVAKMQQYYKSINF